MGLSQILAMLGAGGMSGLGGQSMSLGGAQTNLDASPLASLPGGLTSANISQFAPGTVKAPSMLNNIGSALQSTAKPDQGFQPFDANFGLAQRGGGLGALLAQILGNG